MKSLKLTYDGEQHATALREPHHSTLAIDCPFRARGDVFPPGNLLGVNVAGCMLRSMGGLSPNAFNVPKDFEPTDRLKMERATGLCPIKHSFGEDTVVTGC